MGVIPTILGGVGGIWGLLAAGFLTFLVAFLSALVGGEPSLPTQVLLLTTFLGSFLGIVGAATTSASERTRGIILVTGAALAFLGFSFQEPSRTQMTSPSLASVVLTTVLLFGWIALMFVAGLIGLIRTLTKESSQIEKKVA